MDSEVPSMQLLSGVLAAAALVYDESEHSFLSTLQQSFVSNGSDDTQQDELEDAERTLVASKNESLDEAIGGQEIDADETNKTNDETAIFVPDRSSWSLVTKHTVKGCL